MDGDGMLGEGVLGDGIDGDDEGIDGGDDDGMDGMELGGCTDGMLAGICWLLLAQPVSPATAASSPVSVASLTRPGLS